MRVVNGRGRYSFSAAAHAFVGVEQLHFNFAVSVMHVTPFEHFVYVRENIFQQIHIAPVEQ